MGGCRAGAAMSDSVERVQPGEDMRKIIHIDCDCFYAAVEIRDDPRLRGRPVAVGGDPNRRGVIATCNYEARHFGVHSAMASSQALRRCPELVILPPQFDKYRKASAAIQQIFHRYTPHIEPLSLDEAFLDVTDCPQFDNSATRIAEAIRAAVRSEIGITVSAGVAPNKFLAKIASDWHKPDGLFVIRPDQVAAFVRTLPVTRLHGVGRVTAGRLEALGVKTCEDLQQLSRLTLGQHFGSFGERLFQLARGEDERPVHSTRRRKSVSVEETFATDLPTLKHWQEQLPELLERLRQRMARLDHGYMVQGLSAKIRYTDFSQATCDGPGDVLDAASFGELLAALWARRGEPARLVGIGVRVRDLDEPRQPDLFEEERRQALARQRERL